MQHASLNDLIYMSGHGPYVWSAFGVSLLALFLLVYLPMRKHRNLLKSLREQERLALLRVAEHSKRR